MKTIQGRFRAALLMGAAVSVLAFASGVKAQNTWPYATTDKPPMLAVVGDIACQPGTAATMEGGGETCTTVASPYTSTSLWQSQEATANQIEAMQPDAVALLGDLQYQVGRYSDFEGSFDLTYGAFKFITRPAPGNHEFYDEHSETGVAGYGYFSYYNGFQVDTTNDASEGQPLTVTISDPCPVPTLLSCKVGKTPPANLSPQPIPREYGQAGRFEPTGGVETATYYNGPSAGAPAPTGLGDGWYSYNLGSWHLIALNIECYTQPDTARTDGCLLSNAWITAETEWLKNDLAANHSECTLAYWHQPTYSATDGVTEEGTTAGAWWKLLYDAGADVVLNGHDHLYARYAPIRPYFDDSDNSPTSGVTGTWLGTSDPDRGIREFIVGTGGETLDPVVAASTSATDWDGMFNQQFLQAATGDYWGVMAMKLYPNGYKWDFESALAGPAALSNTVPPVNGPTLPTPAVGATSYSDKGFGFCHNSPDRDRHDHDGDHDDHDHDH